ncbi:MAG: site-specific DNA-methyltransferase [Candidatus Sumerlaeota bacterium]|nr:site-specific DNA-methyltransferase [Candidatus Sumerlaeota bacterium]
MKTDEWLETIKALDARLHRHFQSFFQRDMALTRALVSYQDSKALPAYRWYKFKEAFSPTLVEYLLESQGIHSGRLLDPFAGSGAALFAASVMGLEADGIELLPIGQRIISTRLCLQNGFNERDICALIRWAKTKPWNNQPDHCSFSALRITQGAYPQETAQSIELFLAGIQRESEHVRQVLLFALLCILESVSYTRKDGQYLRWDYRSERRQGAKPFNKGNILRFDHAIEAKLEEIIADIKGGDNLFDQKQDTSENGKVQVLGGSCLEILPSLPGSNYDVIVTSPPYCNRYDYTRTYALELAMLGTGEEALARLRQQMLSCTVENRAKDLRAINAKWEAALQAVERQELLKAILCYLQEQKEQGGLNNNGIPRMIRGYFCEMACVIQECARVLKKSGIFIMVNDNVRYAGASISVDMILSSIAQALGFHLERILVLPKGKGNSSQQMGKHGREALRKCVYVWRNA